MALTHELLFYETMHRLKYEVYPLPWWVQQYLKQWSDAYDSGLFLSKEAAFASNAHFRYWDMTGVKDHKQESLIGQAGEIEPVYDGYSMSFFLFVPSTKTLILPQRLSGARLNQYREDNYLPVYHTEFSSPLGIKVHQKVISTTVGVDQRSVVCATHEIKEILQYDQQVWFCISLSPVGPTGFQRHDKAGRNLPEMGITLIEYSPAEQRFSKINTRWGPIFDRPPEHYGIYGNGFSYAPDFYVRNNPYKELMTSARLNGYALATDHIGGMCTAVLCWELPPDSDTFILQTKLPIDDYRGTDDLHTLQNAIPADLERRNIRFWKNKLDHDGLQFSFTPKVRHLEDVYRICRSNLLILSDHGEIHPGPTIYDSFWVRDSAVEGIACALAGDTNLARRQFGDHYPKVFNMDPSVFIENVSLFGFFGGKHEKDDREWDSNGQALWAISRLDRILGPGEHFGESLYAPYIIEAARWLNNNRSPYGLLHHGWSAEHLGDKNKPHYWDDLWGMAGLYEAARLAGRYQKPEEAEIWSIYESLRTATVNSIRWVLTEQRKRGFWETFIPTGPADVGLLDSTLIGTVAYFHPCRLYDGLKLGADIDLAARFTLDTIWNHFIKGGFCHDSAWQCYGPYLTLQLAHAFLFTGELEKMDQLLKWTVRAGNVSVGGMLTDESDIWKVVIGAWNEQHCYPVANNFEGPILHERWYMGDIPHGWACAEFMLLIRDILFFEVAEDTDPQIYIAPGIMPHWYGDGDTITVRKAPTIFGVDFGYQMLFRGREKTIQIKLTSGVPGVRYIYPFRLPNRITGIEIDGRSAPVVSRDIELPVGFGQAIIRFD